MYNAETVCTQLSRAVHSLNMDTHCICASWLPRVDNGSLTRHDENGAPANKEEADHFKFSRPTSVVISWILLVTKEVGAVPAASNHQTMDQYRLPRVIGITEYHFIQSKLEWNISHVGQRLLCVGSLFFETCPREPIWDVFHWAGG